MELFLHNFASHSCLDCDRNDTKTCPGGICINDTLNCGKKHKEFSVQDSPMMVFFSLENFWSLRYCEVLSRWGHNKETIWALLFLCEGNPFVTYGSLHKRPVLESFNLFYFFFYPYKLLPVISAITFLWVIVVITFSISTVYVHVYVNQLYVEFIWRNIKILMFSIISTKLGIDMLYMSISMG